MGSIKKMVEETIPGIDVLSLMIGKTVIQVLSNLWWTGDRCECFAFAPAKPDSTNESFD
jgi:hypothetical protein